MRGPRLYISRAPAPLHGFIAQTVFYRGQRVKIGRSVDAFVYRSGFPKNDRALIRRSRHELGVGGICLRFQVVRPTSVT